MPVSYNNSYPVWGEDTLTAELYEDSWRWDEAHGQSAAQNPQAVAFHFCKVLLEMKGFLDVCI